MTSCFYVNSDMTRLTYKHDLTRLSVVQMVSMNFAEIPTPFTNLWTRNASGDRVSVPFLWIAFNPSLLSASKNLWVCFRIGLNGHKMMRQFSSFSIIGFDTLKIDLPVL